MNEISYDSPRPQAVQDLSQTMMAQQAAGPVQTEELARNFLARMQRDIDEQVDLRVQQRLATWKAPKAAGSDMKEVAITSLIIGMILTVTKASDLGDGGIAIVWVGIVAVNFVWAIVSLLRRS